MGVDEVVELRQYTLRPGGLDPLLDVFDRHFVTGQQDVGMRILGTFADTADPDRFVWLRAFDDLTHRHRALAGFYGGPVWAEHGPAANATMIDSDDVLLLRPAASTTTLGAPAFGAPGASVHLAAYVHDGAPDLEEWLEDTLVPTAEAALGTAVAAWRSHPGPNSFGPLPVRPDRAFVWAAAFADRRTHDEALARLGASPAWRDDVAPALDSRVTAQALRLTPTPTRHRYHQE